MKKFIITITVLLALLFVGFEAYYRLGVNVDLGLAGPVTTFMKTDETTIYMERDGEYVPFRIQGVNMGSGIPGKWATDFAIDKETYMRWFGMIQEMGANTIRVYTILQQEFYDAFYAYNTERERAGLEPLYLIHGVWVNDYILFSHRDAYAPEFLDVLLKDCRTLVDVLHGAAGLHVGYDEVGNGVYTKDVSRWVIGYILGVEWEDYTVIYTNETQEGNNRYDGEYLYTTEDASPFEAMLARVGDNIIEYESNRYRQQRLIAFSNWPTTDPFVYPVSVGIARQKFATVNVEHIKSKESFISGMFASYHAYPYFPDYLGVMDDASVYTFEDIENRVGKARVNAVDYTLSKMEGPRIEDYYTAEDCVDSYGRKNTYLAYLTALARYHTIPVVIAEYGVTTGRGMAQVDRNTNRCQGHMTEQEQGQALIDCYKDILVSGCAGGIAFTWQDEWFKRTWNTMHAVDLDNTAYWSDYQTNEQLFGILTFDPGQEKSVCYVDGDLSEWSDDDRVVSYKDMDLSVKYDEKFVYFLIHKDGFARSGETLYIPIDTNPKLGSTYAQDQGAKFERAADFLMVIHGREDSRLLVQERYDCLRAIYFESYYTQNPYFYNPEADSPKFTEIYMALTLDDEIPNASNQGPTGDKFETGKLRYGNANPDSPDFDSLADYIFSGDYVEVRIPWQLLNFSNPSEMMIHDDYYVCHGIENIHIDEMYVGVGSGSDLNYRIPMKAVALEGWGKHPTSHERLKRSYYMLRDYWMSLDGENS